MFGCASCIPPEPTIASELGLAVVAELRSESHLSVSIRRCTVCGQQFVWIFTETIDWDRDDDPQCRSVMPLTADEAARAIERGEDVDFETLHALAARRQFLRDDWPSSEVRTCLYTTGSLIGQHD